MSTWKERGKWNGKGGRKGARAQEGKKGTRNQEREEGASSPFYSESGTPGCCQVTVGQSLDKMPTEARRCVSELESLKVVSHVGVRSQTWVIWKNY